MRILVLGGDGMLGHQLLRQWRDRHEVRVTLRLGLDAYQHLSLFNIENSFDCVDASNTERIGNILRSWQPAAVVNAIGVVKQRDDANKHIPSLEINALFPHRLAELCGAAESRLVHVSTDCVFSGRKGSYTEDDPCDVQDIYGMTKFLGELGNGEGITFRTSIIGLELTRKSSLIEWFLSQGGSIRGFRKAIYSRLTTMEMSRVIERVLASYSELTGLWHIASRPIDKYTLLKMLAEKLGRTDVTIEPYDDFVCDRSLDGSRFDNITGYSPPEWGVMLDELATEIQERERRR